MLDFKLVSLFDVQLKRMILLRRSQILFVAHSKLIFYLEFLINYRQSGDPILSFNQTSNVSTIERVLDIGPQFRDVVIEYEVCYCLCIESIHFKYFFN